MMKGMDYGGCAGSPAGASHGSPGIAAWDVSTVTEPTPTRQGKGILPDSSTQEPLVCYRFWRRRKTPKQMAKGRSGKVLGPCRLAGQERVLFRTR